MPRRWVQHVADRPHDVVEIPRKHNGLCAQAIRGNFSDGRIRHCADSDVVDEREYEEESFSCVSRSFGCLRCETGEVNSHEHEKIAAQAGEKDGASTEVCYGEPRYHDTDHGNAVERNGKVEGDISGHTCLLEEVHGEVDENVRGSWVAGFLRQKRERHCQRMAWWCIYGCLLCRVKSCLMII
jgi:hypothetical protein